MIEFIQALRFLTILPLYEDLKLPEERLGRSTTYFPVVGFLIGACLVIVNLIVSLFFTPFITNIFILITSTLLTGALHLDGFIDTSDGLFSRKSDKEEILRIMKDSSTGSMGLISLFFLLFLKISILLQIPSDLKLPALILMPTIGRFFLVFAITFYPYAKEEGLALVFFKFSKRREFIMALTFTLISVLILLKAIGLISFASVFVFTFLFQEYLRIRIGGITGDTLGATNEISELLFLIFVVIFLSPTFGLS